jgi:hypothetical protein
MVAMESYVQHISSLEIFYALWQFWRHFVHFMAPMETYVQLISSVYALYAHQLYGTGGNTGVPRIYG